MKFELSASKRKRHRIEKVPIVCVIGEPGCGKSHVSALISQFTEFELVNCEDMQKKDLKSLQERLFTAPQAKGYILDGFPCTFQDAVKFDKTIGTIRTIIYLTLTLDALLGRSLHANPNLNINQARIKHLSVAKNMGRIIKKFPKITIKVYSDYPITKTVIYLAALLEDKFDLDVKLPATYF